MAGLLASACASLGGAEPPAAPAEEPAPIVLTWTTASEVESYGFHVYRARAADGPFERVNDEIIPGAGTTDLERSYTYVDDEAEVGVTHYYYVESVSLAGERRRFTPVRAFVRRPAGHEE